MIFWKIKLLYALAQFSLISLTMLTQRDWGPQTPGYFFGVIDVGGWFEVKVCGGRVRC